MASRSAAANADVAVVGRGVVGLAAALAISRAGLATTLVGAPAAPAPDDPWDLRVFALSPASRSLLESLGVWHALDAARVAPVYDMRVFREFGAGGQALRFSAYEARIEALAWIVEQRNLMRALGQALRFAGLSVIDAGLEDFDGDDAPTGHSDPALRLRLDGGRRLDARLVVGADGANSRVRAAAGIGWSATDYRQRALVAHFDTGQPHRDVAWQWFGTDGVLALLPLPSGPAASDAAGRVSMVWSAPLALADELQALAPDALAARVEAASGSALGALRPISRVDAFPLQLGRAATTIEPRVALAGDAAHLVHPLAGQGLNLGLGDVAALAQVLRGREPGRDPGERMLLRRYERARAGPVAAMRGLTDGLQRWFDPARRPVPAALGPLVESAVALGWQAVEGSRWLKRQWVAQAVR